MLGDSIEFTPERDAAPCKIWTKMFDEYANFSNEVFIDEKL